MKVVTPIHEAGHAVIAPSQNCGSAQEENSMFKVPVTFEKQDVPEEEYVRVCVSGRSDSGQVVGHWEYWPAVSSGRRLHVQKDGPKPISEAWEQALGYAQSQGVNLIYVDDPQGLFPRDELGVRKV